MKNHNIFSYLEKSGRTVAQVQGLLQRKEIEGDESTESTEKYGM